ncbi:MAG: hypothetical protein KDB96_12375 [Flavobacteriales bacterium]|nr:hypothetical protein [Flavobacteriales bacterium]
MNAPKVLVVGLSTLVILLSGCKEDEPIAPLDLGYGYFPTHLGRWVEYQVDSVWRDDVINSSGQLTYSLREVIEEDHVDNEGRPAQRIRRYVLDTLGNWVVRDVWTQTLDATSAERTEENLRLLKLVFPVRGGQFWDLNSRNTEDELEMTYTAWDVPWSVNGMAFDSTALVETTFFNNLVDTVIHTERYAKGVGLVYQRRVVSNTQTIFNPPAPPQVEIRGSYLTMTATAWGDQ